MVVLTPFTGHVGNKDLRMGYSQKSTTKGTLEETVSEGIKTVSHKRN